MRFSDVDVVSFDCYGTLIDWESGILGVLRPFCAANGVDVEDNDLLRQYGQIESHVQRGPYQLYRDVLRDVMRGMAAHFGVSKFEVEALANSLPNWRPFVDTVPALRRLKKRYRLAIISNIDDDLIAATAKHLEISFDHIITAEQVGAYKPSHKNFERALETVDVPRQRLLHVAESRYHDIAPTKAMGIANVWVNRTAGKRAGATAVSDAVPDFEVPDLDVLVGVIEGTRA